MQEEEDMEGPFHLIVVITRKGEMNYLKHALREALAWELGGFPAKIITALELVQTPAGPKFLLVVPTFLGKADYALSILKVWSEDEQIPFECELVG